MKHISTTAAPAAIGPYAQAIQFNNVVWTSGQLPVNPKTNEIAEGITKQTEQSCQNVEAILKASGSDMSQVIKTTCYLSDMNDFAEFNAVYERYFISKPARSCVAVKQLPKNVRCEIEAVALLKAGEQNE